MGNFCVFYSFTLFLSVFLFPKKDLLLFSIMHRYGSSRRQFILKNKAAFKIQVLSMLVIKCQGKFIIFQFASAMHQQKNCLGLRRNFCIFVGNGFGIPQHFAKGYDLFFQQLILILPVLYCLLVVHLNGRNKRQYFSCWSPCFGFFVCPCYNRRTQ